MWSLPYPLPQPIGSLNMCYILIQTLRHISHCTDVEQPINPSVACSKLCRHILPPDQGIFLIWYIEQDPSIEYMYTFENTPLYVELHPSTNSGAPFLNPEGKPSSAPLQIFVCHILDQYFVLRRGWLTETQRLLVSLLQLQEKLWLSLFPINRFPPGSQGSRPRKEPETAVRRPRYPDYCAGTLLPWLLCPICAHGVTTTLITATSVVPIMITIYGEGGNWLFYNLATSNHYQCYLLSSVVSRNLETVQNRVIIVAGLDYYRRRMPQEWLGQNQVMTADGRSNWGG